MSLKNPNPVNPIVLEGLWGLGKTSLAQSYCTKYGYTFMPEPFHTRDSRAGEIEDVDEWYLEQHKSRQRFFKQSTLIERSVLSSFAFRYAKGDGIPDVSYLISLKKDLEEERALLVHLIEDTSSENYSKDLEGYSTEIQKILLDKNARLRYQEWYTKILPQHYGILPFQLKVSVDRVRRPLNDLVNDIHAVLVADRIAQANIVCFTRESESGGIKILTLKRNEQKGGFWQTVTGGIRPAEEPLTAARREVSEETAVGDSEVFWTPVSYSFPGSDGYELDEYVFGSNIKDSSCVKLSAEHIAFEWLEPEEAKKRVLHENNKIAIDAVCKKTEQPR